LETPDGTSTLRPAPDIYPFDELGRIAPTQHTDWLT